MLTAWAPGGVAVALASDEGVNRGRPIVAATHTRSESVPDPDADADADVRPSTWYGWKTLAADAISIGLMPVFGLGVLGYAFATPIIHGLHDNGYRGLGSALYRSTGMLMFLIGALNSAFSCEDSTSTDCTVASTVAVVGGAMVLSAPVLDALIAWESPPRRRWSLHVTPTFARGHTGLSVHGQF